VRETNNAYNFTGKQGTLESFRRTWIFEKYVVTGQKWLRIGSKCWRWRTFMFCYIVDSHSCHFPVSEFNVIRHSNCPITGAANYKNVFSLSRRMMDSTCRRVISSCLCIDISGSIPTRGMDDGCSTFLYCSILMMDWSPYLRRPVVFLSRI